MTSRCQDIESVDGLVVGIISNVLSCYRYDGSLFSRCVCVDIR